MPQHLLVSLKLQRTDPDNHKATVETQVLDTCSHSERLRSCSSIAI
jgi:hypothetical protein